MNLPPRPLPTHCFAFVPTTFCFLSFCTSIFFVFCPNLGLYLFGTTTFGPPPFSYPIIWPGASDGNFLANIQCQRLTVQMEGSLYNLQ